MPLAAWLTPLPRCNKNYKKGSPVISPDGQFPVPATSSSTLFALRCTPIYKPYIAEDVTSNAGFIIDTVVTHTQVRGAKPIALGPAIESMTVSISIGRNVLAVGQVPVNATKFEIPFSLTKSVPRKFIHCLLFRCLPWQPKLYHHRFVVLPTESTLRIDHEVRLSYRRIMDEAVRHRMCHRLHSCVSPRILHLV